MTIATELARGGPLLTSEQHTIKSKKERLTKGSKKGGERGH